jgi:S-adenosyl-L-homocysteine hydrolase
MQDLHGAPSNSENRIRRILINAQRTTLGGIHATCKPNGDGIPLVALSGASLTQLRKDQADYIGVNPEGPFKSDHHRY